MQNTSSKEHMENECRRLRQQVERDGGTQNLSQTDRAFLESYCHYDDDPLPKTGNSGLINEGGVDESAHLHEGTLFGDPDAGRPDDPDDANPAAPDPAITKE